MNNEQKERLIELITQSVDGCAINWAETIANLPTRERCFGVAELACIIENDTEETQYEFYKEVITE